MFDKLIPYLNSPIQMGAKKAPGRLFLAPMAGLTTVAFRQLTAEFGGCGLMFSEMCSAKALPMENRRISSVFRWADEELPTLVCQIFGADPKVMALAAKRVEAEGFFGVDINMGCSVAAICKQGAGAALLRDSQRAAEVVAAVREAVSIPVTVKFRTGWTDAPESAVELAERFAGAGADALTFHPRVAPDRRSRPPKWDYIRAVKQAVSIPVFGNGDVFDEADCLRMLEDTGCDGIAIGRIAISKPWIFAQWSLGIEPGKDVFRYCAHRLLDLLHLHYEPVNALRRYKKWIGYFAANFTYGHRFSSIVRKSGDIDGAKKAVDEFLETAPALCSRPNLNLFR